MLKPNKIGDVLRQDSHRILPIYIYRRILQQFCVFVTGKWCHLPVGCSVLNYATVNNRKRLLV